ncbi:hypothetical protein MMC34_003947 [Xylographa carneopallida]|nr:hypothetical protein [Xylographa carneopallida]
MSFCAFPSVRRPPQRRPSLVINIKELVEIEKHTDKMISSLQQSTYPTTPLHTTDIIASEYMYPSNTTPMESEHLSVNSSRDSYLSNDDLHSLGFRSQDDPDTPLSSTSSSPSARHHPQTSLGKADLSLQIASKSGPEQLNQWKSSVTRRNETRPERSNLKNGSGFVSNHKYAVSGAEQEGQWKSSMSQRNELRPQESNLRKINGSVSSHKHANSDNSVKLSKSLPPLPPQLNSRNLLRSDNPREPVAQRIAAMGGKMSKDASGPTGAKRPYEARRAASADEGRTGPLTKLPFLKMETSREALPIVPPKTMHPSNPELPSNPEPPRDDKTELPSKTSDSNSDVLFSMQDLQAPEQVSNDSAVLPVMHVRVPIGSQTHRKPSTGLNFLTAMTSKPIVCENPFVGKSSDTKFLAARFNPKENSRPPLIPHEKPTIEATLHNVFTTQRNNKRPTPAPPLTGIHFACYQSHCHMNNSKNDIAQVPCMACDVDDKEIRWKCSWCCLRICNRCMVVLEETKNRDLRTLLQARQKTRHANQPWRSTVWEGIPDGPSF